MQTLVHIDADAFFASVEQAADRRLRGLPVAVGGGHRGVISSASYEARKFGIHSAMPTRRAMQLCPDLIILPGQYELYEQFSNHVFGLCREITPWVEQTSVDEGFLDVSGRTFNTPVVNTIRNLNNEITQWLKITMSTGIGSNKLISAIASKLNKPTGFTLVPPGSETAFMMPLRVRALPGIGPRTEASLHQVGVKTVRDLLRMGPAGLSPLFGRQTDAVLKTAQGIDNRPVTIEKEEEKSRSHQHTFEQDEGSEDRIILILKDSIDRLLEKVRAGNKRARTLSVKIRYMDMEERRASRSLSEPSDLESDFYPIAEQLLKQLWQRRVHLRQTAVHLSHFYAGWEQRELFDQRREKQRRMVRAIDSINRTFEEKMVFRACHLQADSPC